MKFLTLKEVMQYPQPKFIIEEILHRGTLNLLTAYPGVGKSLITMSIAKAVASGLPLWGKYKVLSKGPVVIIDEENPHSYLRERIEKMGLTSDLPIYYSHYQGIKVDDVSVYNVLVDALLTIKPELVIFDSLVRFHGQDENNAGNMAYVMGRMRDIVVQTGCTVIVIHHDRKAYGDKKERVRGSGDITGAVDNQICLEATADQCLVVSTGKTRMIPMLPIKLKLNSDNGSLDFKWLGRC